MQTPCGGFAQRQLLNLRTFGYHQFVTSTSTGSLQKPVCPAPDSEWLQSSAKESASLVVQNQYKHQGCLSVFVPTRQNTGLNY